MRSGSDRSPRLESESDETWSNERRVGPAQRVARADVSGQFPHLSHYNTGPEGYTRLIKEARSAVSMPIVASLNAATPGVWNEQAQRIADAGADALELNLYYVPTDERASAEHVEARYLSVVNSVRKQIEIPLSVKIGPFFTSLPHFARQLVDAGVDGLVLFNRFLEPEIDLDTGRVEPHLELSRPGELRLSIRWLAILRAQLGDFSLAASSGVHTGLDALKAVAAGANVAMVTSALLKHGAEYLQTLRQEMIEWLLRNDYRSVQQICGSVIHQTSSAPSAFERANYANTIASYMEHGPAPN